MPQISSAEIAKHKAQMAKRPKRVNVEQAQNGGYVVSHETDDYPQPKHAFKKYGEMEKHLKAHFGESKAEEKAEAKK